MFRKLSLVYKNSLIINCINHLHISEFSGNNVVRYKVRLKCVKSTNDVHKSNNLRKRNVPLVKNLNENVLERTTTVMKRYSKVSGLQRKKLG